MTKHTTDLPAYDGSLLNSSDIYREAVKVAPIEQIRARHHHLCYHTPLITAIQCEEANILENELIARHEDVLKCGV